MKGETRPILKKIGERLQLIFGCKINSPSAKEVGDNSIVLQNVTLTLTNSENLEERFCKMEEEFRGLEEYIENVAISRIVEGIARTLNVAIKELQENAIFDVGEETDNIIKEIVNISDENKEIKKILEEMQSNSCTAIINLRHANDEILFYVQQLKESLNGNFDDLKDLVKLLLEKWKEQNKILMSRLLQMQDKQEKILDSYSQFNPVMLSGILDDIKDIKKQVGENGNNEKRMECIEKAKAKIAIDISNVRECQLEIRDRAITNGKKLDDISKWVQDIYESIQNTGLKSPSESQIIGEKQELRDKIKKLKEDVDKLSNKLNESQEENKALRSMGKYTDEIPCLYCGYKAKMLIWHESKCYCTICGHNYCYNIDQDMIEINMSGKSDDEIKEDRKEGRSGHFLPEDIGAGNQWKKEHKAKIYNTTDDQAGKKGLYRIELDINTVSNKGALIIPSLTETGQPVKQIAYCNVEKDEDREKLSRVKTLFLSEGITIVQRKDNGKYPFGEMVNLERVMTFKDGGYAENLDYFKKIRG